MRLITCDGKITRLCMVNNSQRQTSPLILCGGKIPVLLHVPHACSVLLAALGHILGAHRNTEKKKKQSRVEGLTDQNSYHSFQQGLYGRAKQGHLKIESKSGIDHIIQSTHSALSICIRVCECV